MLPDGFTFDIHVNNPIFSNDGAASIATTLPATNENCTILERPERLARSSKPVRKFPAILKHGPFQKKCSMIIAGCSKATGIEASLAFYESELYAELKGKNMKDLFDTINVSSSDFNISSLANLMSDLYSSYYKSSTVHQNFAIFPVAIEKDDNGVKILNEVNENGFVYAKRNITSGEDTISVPEGYGVTPFLWLHRAVRLLFELSGYEVSRNDFESLPFSRIVLVNNCSDIFCKGPKISFRHLVPSVKVEEFLLWLYDRFGAVVAVNGKSVRIMLQQELLASGYDLDLSNYVRGNPSLSFPVSSRVVLKADTSLDSAEPAAESLLDFREKHSIVRAKAIGEDPEANGVIFRKQLGKYYQVSMYGSGSQKETLLGSNCFPYDRDNSDDSEEYTAVDRFLPEVLVNNMLMPYIGNRLHYNTSLSNQSEEENQQIQICYAHRSSDRWFGSTQQYSESGTIIQNEQSSSYPALTPEELYPLCWSRYNEMLLNSAPTITAQIDYPTSLLMTMDICTPKLLNGVQVIIKSYSYQVSSNGIKCGESILQVLPAYKNQITDGTITFDSGSFVWVVEDTMFDELAKLVVGRQDYDILNYDGKTDYTAADAPSYTPSSAGLIAKRRSRWVNVEIIIRGVSEDIVLGQQQISYEEYFISVGEDSDQGF